MQYASMSSSDLYFTTVKTSCSIFIFTWTLTVPQLLFGLSLDLLFLTLNILVGNNLIQTFSNIEFKDIQNIDIHLKSDINANILQFNNLTQTVALLHPYPVDTREHYIQEVAFRSPSGDSIVTQNVLFLFANVPRCIMS